MATYVTLTDAESELCFSHQKAGTSTTILSHIGTVIHLLKTFVHCFLQGERISLKVEKFKYIVVKLMSDDEKKNQALDVHLDETSVIMRALHHSIVSKRELLRKAESLVS